MEDVLMNENGKQLKEIQDSIGELTVKQAVTEEKISNLLTVTNDIFKKMKRITDVVEIRFRWTIGIFITVLLSFVALTGFILL